MLDASRYRGDYLVVESSKPLYLFIEGKMAASDARQIYWPVDSIRDLFGRQTLWLNLYQPQGIQPDVRIYIKTLLSVPAQREHEPGLKQVKPYHDFLLSALVFSVIMMFGILRVNRLLFISYLGVASLFSFRENENHPMYNRVTNTSNILMLILVAFIYSSLRIHPDISGQSFASLWKECFENVVVMGILLLAKGLLIFLFSAMFNISAWKGLQYIGFIRYLFLLGLVLMGIQVAGVFIFSSFYLNPMASRLFIWISGIIWLILIWGKLSLHTRFSAIHLFSYLCATEIGPLLLAATTIWKV